MSDWNDEDDDEDEYFSSTLDGAELTGKEPKFLAIDSMKVEPSDLVQRRTDELIKTYIAARNQLATDRKGYKAREAAVKLHMSIISMIFRDRGDQAGVDTFATAEGTAYRNKKETFRVGDWPVLVEYIKNTGNFQIVQKRVAPNAVKEIREADGEIPPGIEPHVEVEFSVRSPTTRKSRK